ncbi:cyclin N-terminal domain-containing protein 1-like [Lycorma delicatula]|uniref:cyclin N-terminal domain-containing protein 1-like n=1 Tax=Lycorma delicatula TaxID=130591 RepID=UPI003F50EC00
MNQSSTEDLTDSQQSNWENLSKEMLELWFEHLKNEENYSQKQCLMNCMAPFLAVPMTVVQTIFYICEEFQQPPEVRYLTVELFDRFVNNQFLMLFPKIWPTDINGAVFENHGWKRISDRIKNQSLLRIMSCLSLASKFIMFNKMVPLKKIQEFLHKIGSIFSVKTILASEMRVYRMLDYKLCFPKVLTYTDLLIELIDLPGNVDKKWLHKFSLKVIDVTYLFHQEIFYKLFYYSTGRWEKTYEERKQFMETECNNSFLAAAIVTTTMTFLQPDCHAILNQIAIELNKLTDVPSDDIIALASIITMIILT